MAAVLSGGEAPMLDPVTLGILIQVLLPLAIQGAEGLYDLIDNHVKSGGTLTPEQVAALAVLAERLRVRNVAFQALPILPP